MTAASTKTKNLLPFRANTRQRLQPVQRVTITAGQRVSVELPRVGFIAGLILNFRAQPTWTSDPAFVLGGIWNVLRRCNIALNLGTANIVDVSGYGLLTYNRDMMSRGFSPEALGLTLNATDGTPWKWSLFVPVSMNDGNQFNVGLINLQAPEIRCTIDLSFYSALTDIATGLTALAGTVDISYLYYEVPDPTKVMYPSLTLHRLLEERTNINGVGDTIYTVPRQGTLFQLAHNITLNGGPEYPGDIAGTQNITGMRLLINKTDEIYRLLPDVVNFWNAMKKGAVGAGTFYSGIPSAWLFDFMSATGDRGSGDARDTIDSEACSTLESYVTVASGATVGTAYIDTLRRIVQVLQV